MKLHVFLTVGLALGIMGCAEKEQAAPEPEIPAETPAAEAVDAPAAEPEAAEAPAGEPESWRTRDFIDHMHAHAEHLDDLNFALDDGDLDEAATAAYWLSRHKTVGGLPDDLRPFVENMREAARAVQDATDLETARAAAGRIGSQCQGCHTAVGVMVE